MYFKIFILFYEYDAKYKTLYTFSSAYSGL